MKFTKMKDLYTNIFRRNKALILIASFLVIASLTGLFIYQGTKKNVSLTLNGNKKEIKTHAETVHELLGELKINYKKQDYLSPSVNAKVKDNMQIVWKPAYMVILKLNGEEKKVWTTRKTVKEFLAESEIAIKEQDQLSIPLEAKIKQGLLINLDTAFQVVVNDGGEERTVWSTSTTVADFLEQQGIKLNELDRVEPGLDQMIGENVPINIVRVEKVTDVVEEPLEFATVTQKDSNLESGKQQVVQEGKTGKVQKTYEVILENGQEVSKTLISENVMENATDKIVAVGTKEMTQLVSRGTETGKEFYVSSTAYTASCNGCSGKTATGIDLHANPGAKIIAVDPSVIPLGTKVYVEGYGYAIAADTGTRIKGNKIDVFFASQSDAYRWGQRTVKIKILQ
ncbi:ubiquitin-like domain-containing protein [Caldibacillus sp. 210928-DFI.2.22]|uniref:G5 and 3D domain-containing protein n=1 Tax=unclassified Caldibacillus TaxID=2641266 RepID=UPI001D06D684|nr:MULTISPECIES: G5 and 3D domain-containing protein [unclassified Caldibacillus]MCB7068967.1 ubiquitin-like domain-containing protein [Caldibacillus sp. 210928-DFI.2.22]MCB7072276.1 ubiquitin-like domain-containing protein [Caldibacillus sp. 210928-DFI.2.18]